MHDYLSFLHFLPQKIDLPRFPLDQRTQGGLRVFREIIVPSVRIGRSNIYTLKGERQRSAIERCLFFIASLIKQKKQATYYVT